MNNHTIKDAVLTEIRSGHVRMLPRMYYIGVLVVVGVLITLITFLTLFIGSFVAFAIRINSHDALLGFGPRGISAFLWFFPWSYAALDIALIILARALMRTFRLGYRTPALYLVTGGILIAAVGGPLLDRYSDMHDRLHEQRQELPSLFGFFYRGVHHPHDPGSGLCQCTVVGVSDTAVLLDDKESSTTLQIPREQLPSDVVRMLKPGSRVFVAGDERDGRIDIFGIHPLPPLRTPQYAQ